MSNTQGRILALDLGTRRIGIAVSDELRLTAQGLEVMERTNLREDVARLTHLADDYGVTLVLVGDPRHMDGSQGRQSAWAGQFADKLQERSGLPVQLWDERLTSVEAGRVLRESGISREKRARAVDRLAAVILLESYIAAMHSGSSSEDATA